MATTTLGSSSLANGLAKFAHDVVDRAKVETALAAILNEWQKIDGCLQVVRDHPALSEADPEEDLVGLMHDLSNLLEDVNEAAELLTSDKQSLPLLERTETTLKDISYLLRKLANPRKSGKVPKNFEEDLDDAIKEFDEDYRAIKKMLKGAQALRRSATMLESNSKSSSSKAKSKAKTMAVPIKGMGDLAIDEEKHSKASKSKDESMVLDGVPVEEPMSRHQYRGSPEADSSEEELDGGHSESSHSDESSDDEASHGEVQSEEDQPPPPKQSKKRQEPSRSKTTPAAMPSSRDGYQKGSKAKPKPASADASQAPPFIPHQSYPAAGHPYQPMSYGSPQPPTHGAYPGWPYHQQSFDLQTAAAAGLFGPNRPGNLNIGSNNVTGNTFENIGNNNSRVYHGPAPEKRKRGTRA